MTRSTWYWTLSRRARSRTAMTTLGEERTLVPSTSNGPRNSHHTSSPATAARSRSAIQRADLGSSKCSDARRRPQDAPQERARPFGDEVALRIERDRVARSLEDDELDTSTE